MRSAGRAAARRQEPGWSWCPLVCRRDTSADVHVVLAAGAVVAEVQDLMVDEAANGAVGLGLVIDAHPDRGAAVLGVVEVERHCVRIVGQSADDSPHDRALSEEALMVMQDLSTRVDAEAGAIEPGRQQRASG